MKKIISNAKYVIKKPYLALRAIRNYAKMLLGKKQLRSVQIDIGYECNMQCSHCYSHYMLDKTRKELTIDEWKSIIDDAIKLGALHFCISGGEPTLYENKLIQMIECIHKTKSYSAIVTNGILLDSAYISRLKKAGLDMIIVSLDSWNSNDHDKNRNMQGSYKKAVNAIKLAKSFGFKVMANTAISEKANIEDIEKIKAVNDSIGVETHINFLSPIGKYGDKTKKAGINQGMLAMPNIHTCTDRNYLGKYCPAGKEKILITAYGDIMPCALVQISFGNIKKNSLSNIWNNMFDRMKYIDSKETCFPISTKENIKKIISKIQKSRKLPIRKLPVNSAAVNFKDNLVRINK